MLIQDYGLPKHQQYLVNVGTTAGVFREDAPAGVSRAKLLVWHGAFLEAAIVSALQAPDWPMRLFSGLPLKLGWNWKVRCTTDGDPIENVGSAERAIELASGAAKPASGNIMASLEIRDYQDLSSGEGRLEWWQERKRHKAGDQPFVVGLLAKVIEVLQHAREHSIELCTEKVSIVLAKDEMAPLATNMPVLHSDLYYGRRETAIGSILEQGFNPYGAGIFLPTLDMEMLKSEGEISIHEVSRVAQDHPIVRLNSGDLALYDGMIDHDGTVKLANGVPHISPDVPGKSARLSILMRRLG